MSQVTKIEYTKRFTKQYAKLNPKAREQFKRRQRLWLDDPYNPALRLHTLQGEYAGVYSFNVSGDLRALYEKVDDTYVILGLSARIASCTDRPKSKIELLTPVIG